jgi:hypothetical protein
VDSPWAAVRRPSQGYGWETNWSWQAHLENTSNILALTVKMIYMWPVKYENHYASKYSHALRTCNCSIERLNFVFCSCVLVLCDVIFVTLDLLNQVNQKEFLSSVYTVNMCKQSMVRDVPFLVHQVALSMLMHVITIFLCPPTCHWDVTFTILEHRKW